MDVNIILECLLAVSLLCRALGSQFVLVLQYANKTKSYFESAVAPLSRVILKHVLILGLIFSLQLLWVKRFLGQCEHFQVLIG